MLLIDIVVSPPYISTNRRFGEVRQSSHLFLMSSFVVSHNDNELFTSY